MGSEWFCLVLLRRMADYRPDDVADALRASGVSRTTMREVNAQWQRMLRSRSVGGTAGAYAIALGEPGERASRTVGDLVVEVRRWALPLWPDLRFEIVLGSDGRVWQEWLVRADPATLPHVRAVADLRPWEFVVEDVARAFPGVRHVQGSAPSRWTSLVDEGGTTYRLHFVWGLLQEVAREGEPETTPVP